MAGGGDLTTRFSTKSRLMVWQAAAMGSTVSGSNFCVGLMSNGYTVGWYSCRVYLCQLGDVNA